MQKKKKKKKQIIFDRNTRTGGVWRSDARDIGWPRWRDLELSAKEANGKKNNIKML